MVEIKDLWFSRGKSIILMLCYIVVVSFIVIFMLTGTMRKQISIEKTINSEVVSNTTESYSKFITNNINKFDEETKNLLQTKYRDLPDKSEFKIKKVWFVIDECNFSGLYSSSSGYYIYVNGSYTDKDTMISEYKTRTLYEV